jgi:hypothetical protein
MSKSRGRPVLWWTVNISILFFMVTFSWHRCSGFGRAEFPKSDFPQRTSDYRAAANVDGTAEGIPT